MNFAGLNATWSKNGTRGTCPASCVKEHRHKNDWVCKNKHDPEVMPYCGYEGRILNMLHSPLTTVHTDRWPLYAPAMWIGECYANGTTKHGWTHQKFKAHLEFLDTVGITRIGIWCQNSCSISNLSNPLDCGDNFVGFACAGLNTTCPYFYEELTAWKARAPQQQSLGALKAGGAAAVAGE